MAVSPGRSLYPTARCRVILALTAAALFAAPLGRAQFGRKATASQGPRALGLLELAANGKGHIVPIVVMDEGKFYDASAYKADPVPMALDPGTVYEAEKSGVSLGLFSISGAMHSNDNRWVGAGTWQPAGSAPKKKAPEAKKHSDDELGGPPVLHRPRAAPQPPAPPSAPEAKTPPAAPVPATPPAPAAPPESAASAGSETRSPDDPDRPTLRRGKPAQEETEDLESAPPTKVAPAKAGAIPAAAKSAQTVQVIPAISDSGGPDPRSFTYAAKPEEIDVFSKKMVVLATSELRSYQKTAVEPIAAQKPVAAKSRAARAAHPPAPAFQDVQMQIFDLAASNEPVLVFTAKALPVSATVTPDLQYFVTIVAREDIYGDLHKVAAKITDTQHTDALPRYELIDAVDADGDGRAELLFRQISDAGKAYAIYRVIGDQLWPLYEGAPQ